MVSVSKVRNSFPNLFSREPVASLEKLLSQYEGELPAFHNQVFEKEKKTFQDRKYLSWLRHSLAFKLKQTSPQKILETWTLDVVELLGEVWDDVFTLDDEISIAFLGKLGSGELNLSSDIDVIFFGSPSFKLKKIREYISRVGDLNVTPSGFKVDLDLRPGGASAPMICSATRLGDHLWNSSDPWERYSYTRMDLQLGHSKTIENVKEIRDKFCYRKYLSSDFFHSFVKMRKDYRVKSVKGEFNVKLGAGGIRDIELFVQTFQILYGGKDVKYRGLSTFELIDLFIKEDLKKDVFRRLKINYNILRQAEGELHALSEQGGFQWVRSKQEDEFEEVLFEAARSSEEAINYYIGSTENIFGSSKKVLGPSSFRDRIEDQLLTGGKSADKALKNLDTYFLSKKNRFESYYSAILSQEKMLESFLDLLRYSDYGCQILSRRPNLLDVFFLRKTGIVHEDEGGFLNSLSDIKMVQRILASSEFKKNLDVIELGQKVSSSYEMILKKIIDPEGGVDLLFFGKMASREMGLSSDLDFIMVTDREKIPTKRAREIYRKLSYLTIFGPLVPYDTDGGPMGKATPVVMTWSSVKDFLQNKAEPWQRLMYLKQRRLFSDETIEYVNEPLTKEEMLSLFDILRERLKVSSYKKDPYKLGMGGLFHIEFIVGAIFLRFGVQPGGQLNIKDLLSRLGLVMNEQEILQKLSENYYKIASERETALIEAQEGLVPDMSLLDESFGILEDLSEKYLYSLKVGM